MEWKCHPGMEVNAAGLPLSDEDKTTGFTTARVRATASRIKGCVAVNWHGSDLHCHVLSGVAPTHAAFMKALAPHTGAGSYNSCLLMKKSYSESAGV